MGIHMNQMSYKSIPCLILLSLAWACASLPNSQTQLPLTGRFTQKNLDSWSKAAADIIAPWGEPRHGLQLRLRIKQTELQEGELPDCFMEVKNISNGTMIIADSFNINGPFVFDRMGRLMEIRNPISYIDEPKWDLYILKPDEIISIPAKPNYVFGKAGETYALSFELDYIEFGQRINPNSNRIWPSTERKDPRPTSNEIKIHISEIKPAVFPPFSEFQNEF